MRIKIINDINDFKKIESVWTRLYSSLENKSVFQTFEYNFYSYSNFLDFKFNSLCVGLVYKEDLISICPFYIDRHKKLRFINDIHSDFCDILSLEYYDFDFFLEKLFSKNIINSCHLVNFNNKSYLLNYVSTNYSYLINSKFSNYSYLTIPKGSFPDNIAYYKSKQKTEIRRIEKKYSYLNHEILNIDNSNFPKSEIIFLRNNMFQRGIRSKSFLDNFKLKLIESLFVSGILQISCIKSKSQVHAISFLLKQDDNYIIWIDIYDSNKLINLFNYISLMSKLSKDKTVGLNFGRGNYSYKTANFLPKTDSLLSLRIFKTNHKKFIFILKKSIVQVLTKIYKYIK